MNYRVFSHATDLSLSLNPGPQWKNNNTNLIFDLHYFKTKTQVYYQTIHVSNKIWKLKM